MATVNLESLKPGMVLGTDVKDRAGRILLASGQEISEKALRVFKMWGVTEADIQGVDQEQVAAMSTSDIKPELLEAAEEKTRVLFAHCKWENPVTKELFRLSTARVARKMEETNGTVNQPA
jgi:hypothetical protein